MRKIFNPHPSPLPLGEGNLSKISLCPINFISSSLGERIKVRGKGVKLVAFLCLFFLFFGPRITLAQLAPNTTCPVMQGERVKQKFFVDYQGERIYLCCRNCMIAFNKKPKKYMKRLAKQREAH